MDTTGDGGSTQPASSTSKPKSNPGLHYQIKQIKPLLQGSSRLGRALAELFSRLVNLCVGSPLRQRRGQQIAPTPAMPSAQARSVAGALTKLLAQGLSWEPPATSPVPKFRLTFYICRWEGWPIWKLVFSFVFPVKTAELIYRNLEGCLAKKILNFDRRMDYIIEKWKNVRLGCFSEAFLSITFC